jgi:hypothetical protein
MPSTLRHFITSRSLDVREEERHRPGRHIHTHGRIISHPIGGVTPPLGYAPAIGQPTRAARASFPNAGQAGDLMPARPGKSLAQVAVRPVSEA